MSPNGRHIVLSSGYASAAGNLQHLGTLSSPILDAASAQGTFETLRADGLYRQPAILSPAEPTAPVEGAGLRVFVAGGAGLVLVVYPNLELIEKPIFSDGYD